MALLGGVQTDRRRRLKRLNWILAGLAAVVAVWILAVLAGFLVVEDSALHLPDGHGGVQTVRAGDLEPFDRVAVLGIVAIPDLFWLAGMAWLIALSRRFARGEVMSRGAVGCLRGFGWMVLGAAVSDAVIVPLSLIALGACGAIVPVAAPWAHVAWTEGLIPLVGAALVLLVAEIVGEAAVLADEASLTI